MTNQTAGPSEFYIVEGYGRFFRDRQHPEKQMTELESRENQFYRFFQLECAGCPDGAPSADIQPVRIRCTAWDRNGMLNASVLDGVPNKIRIRVKGYLEPWFQIWFPTGDPAGVRKSIPEGGREHGHARPWETFLIAPGCCLMETAQLTISEIEIVDEHFTPVSTTAAVQPGQIYTPRRQQFSSEQINRIIAGEIVTQPPSVEPHVEDSNLRSETANVQHPTQNGNRRKSTVYDASEDYLHISARITISELTKTEVKGDIPHRQFLGVANKDYQQNDILVPQQPIRLINTLSGDNAQKVNGWEEGSPVTVEGVLKPLNYLWVPTDKVEGRKVVIPGPGEPNGRSRPWEMIYDPNWDPRCCVITTFKVVVSEINRVDLAEEAKQTLESNSEYRQYLQTPEWKSIRQSVLERDKHLCICGDTATVVHHKTYENVKREEMGDLVSVCRRCHDHIHRYLFQKFLR